MSACLPAHQNPLVRPSTCQVRCTCSPVRTCLRITGDLPNVIRSNENKRTRLKRTLMYVNGPDVAQRGTPLVDEKAAQRWHRTKTSAFATPRITPLLIHGHRRAFNNCALIRVSHNRIYYSLFARDISSISTH